MGRSILPSMMGRRNPWLSPRDDSVYRVIAHEVDRYTKLRDIETGIDYDCELFIRRFEVVEDVNETTPNY